MRAIQRSLQNRQLMRFGKHESKDPNKYFVEEGLRNYVLEAPNQVGILSRIMNVFNTSNIDVSYIDNQFGNIQKDGTHKVDFNLSTEPMDTTTLNHVEKKLSTFGCHLKQGPIFEVDWYPRNWRDLNLIGKVLLDVKDTSGSESQQFKDQEYRKRRDEIAKLSKEHVMGEPIPQVEYSKDQNGVWTYCYEKLRKLHKTCMSQRYEKQMKKLEKNFDFDKNIPQLKHLDDYLNAETGFRLRPTHGILSQREFLNAFAHRVFCSTQYIRHPSNPEYTPQPDIIHEIIGHIPMFADKQVADFSQQIGLLSLGATDKEIAQLGTLYWFTLEFGVCRQNGQVKGYGAGIGSSFGELEHFVSGKPTFNSLNPLEDCNEAYLIQTVQPSYKVTQSFDTALEQLMQFGRTISKKAHMYYDFKNRKVLTNRQIRAVYRGESGPSF